MEIVNLFTVECSDEMEHEGFRIHETQIGPRLGADLVGASVYEVDPGKKLWPYHRHHAVACFPRYGEPVEYWDRES